MAGGGTCVVPPSIEEPYGRSIAVWPAILVGCGFEGTVAMVGHLTSGHGTGRGHADAPVGWTPVGNTAARCVPPMADEPSGPSGVPVLPHDRVVDIRRDAGGSPQPAVSTTAFWVAKNSGENRTEQCRVKFWSIHRFVFSPRT